MTTAPAVRLPLTPAPLLPVATARQTRVRLRDTLQGRWLTLWAAVAALAVDSARALSVDAVKAGRAGDVVSRVSSDVDQVPQVTSGALGDFVAAALTITATLVGLAVLDRRFALAALLAGPLQAYALRWCLRTSQPLYAEGRTPGGRHTSALLGAFTALPTLRALRLGPGRHARVEAASAETMTCELRATHTRRPGSTAGSTAPNALA